MMARVCAIGRRKRRECERREKGGREGGRENRVEENRREGGKREDIKGRAISVLRKVWNDKNEK
jgi:hypothetical protein